MAQRDAKSETRRTWIVAIFGLAGVVVGAVAGALFTAFFNQVGIFAPGEPSARALAEKYDGKYPSDECAADLVRLLTEDLMDSAGTAIGTVELRHSSTCETSWIWVATTQSDVTVVKVVSRAESDELPANEVETTDEVGDATGEEGETFSRQLYAPECVTISVQIIDASGAAIADYPQTEVCT